MKPLSIKADVIAKYELGLSAYMHGKGVALEAMFKPGPADQMLAIARAFATRKWILDRGNPALAMNTGKASLLNPTHYMYDSIFDTAGIIKAELLRDNVMDIPLKRFLIQTGLSRLD